MLSSTNIDEYKLQFREGVGFTVFTGFRFPVPHESVYELHLNIVSTVRTGSFMSGGRPLKKGQPASLLCTCALARRI